MKNKTLIKTSRNFLLNQISEKNYNVSAITTYTKSHPKNKTILTLSVLRKPLFHKQ